MTSRHTYCNGVAWIFETLDGDGGANGRVDAAVGQYSAALLYNGRPHVFYRDDSDKQLRHAYFNGSACGGSKPSTATAVRTAARTEPLAHSTLSCSTTDGHTPLLRQLERRPPTRILETVCSGPSRRSTAPADPAGALTPTSAATTPPGSTAVDARSSTTRRRELNFTSASYNGSAWVFETLDGNGVSNGRTTNSVGLHNTLVLYNGQPHVFYWDAPGGDLRHGWFG